MNRQVENLGSVTVVTLQTSCLDASNALEFKHLMKDLQESSPRLVLDLGWVTFLDSCGCGAILTAIRWLDQVGGHVAICSLTQRARESLGLFQMLRILDIHENREDAIRSFPVRACRV